MSSKTPKTPKAMKGEYFVDIDNDYKISNLGRVWSNKRSIFLKHTNDTNAGKNGRIDWHVSLRGRPYNLARLVVKYIKKIELDSQHKCIFIDGDRNNLNAENLSITPIHGNRAEKNKYFPHVYRRRKSWAKRIYDGNGRVNLDGEYETEIDAYESLLKYKIAMLQTELDGLRKRTLRDALMTRYHMADLDMLFDTYIDDLTTEDWQYVARICSEIDGNAFTIEEVKTQLLNPPK